MAVESESSDRTAMAASVQMTNIEHQQSEELEMMCEVFISYRRESGSEFASFLYSELEKAEYNVFFDAKSLREGEFESDIHEAIDQCTYFMVLLAPGVLDRCFQDPDKDWILNETKRALDNGKIIIPIMIKKGFEFPTDCELDVIRKLSKHNICDLSGTDAADLIQTRLIQQFMHNAPSRGLAKQYNRGIVDPKYREWELKTLKSIYHDIPFVNAFGREFPAYVVPGSKSVTFPFDSLTDNGRLNPIAEPIDYKSLPWFDEFKNIVGPHIHYPQLYGYTSDGFRLDDEGKVCGLYCTPRKYRESVYTCHILQYELWKAYQKIGHERIATLDDLPMRKKIHEGHTNLEVIMDGCNRSALNDVSIAVIGYFTSTEPTYYIAAAERSHNVATFPGYLSLVPSGGFELYELEKKQRPHVIKNNFSVKGALYREYIEELFDGEHFGQPTGSNDMDRLNLNEHIQTLENGVRAGLFQFEFLGVDFDLITLRQTLAFVLRLDEELAPEKDDKGHARRFVPNEENTYVDAIPLKDLENYVNEELEPLIDDAVPTPPMVEMAATYALLQQNHLYQEIVANDYRGIRHPGWRRLAYRLLQQPWIHQLIQRKKK